MLWVVVTFAAWINAKIQFFIDLLFFKRGFYLGKKVSAAVMSLGPKLYHIEIALGHYENWLVLESLPCFKSYMKVSPIRLSTYINEHVLQPMNADFDHGLLPATYSNAPCYLNGSEASIRIPSLLRHLSNNHVVLFS
ncbi:hypothetical protein DKX38_005875 [Salix brachista]|uniref:glutathione transferase n=1 Tax=Salix brachista TaxID=2182728 RepID=A0A5N5N1P4_9ROSI|nr:hypothetical protein DKX38_005875 [Salix brachista]